MAIQRIYYYRTTKPCVSYSDCIENQTRRMSSKDIITNKTATTFNFGDGGPLCTRISSFDLMEGEEAKDVYICYIDARDFFVYFKNTIPTETGSVSFYAKTDGSPATSISELTQYAEDCISVGGIIEVESSIEIEEGVFTLELTRGPSEIEYDLISE